MGEMKRNDIEYDDIKSSLGVYTIVAKYNRDEDETYYTLKDAPVEALNQEFTEVMLEEVHDQIVVKNPVNRFNSEADVGQISFVIDTDGNIRAKWSKFYDQYTIDEDDATKMALEYRFNELDRMVNGFDHGIIASIQTLLVPLMVSHQKAQALHREHKVLRKILNDYETEESEE